MNSLNNSENLNDKKLKTGFTTGSGATLATKASLKMLITGKPVNSECIILPTGDKYEAPVFEQEISVSDDSSPNGAFAKCCVIKESGDDPDITSGIRIFSRVSFINDKDNKEIIITGGEGIGTVTRPGLDQPVGEKAINSTPRKMIRDAVNELLDEYDIEYGIKVEISVPEGVLLAEKTFNPHMGIEGGISIIGTTGIVKPMSTEALLKTIRLDINMQYSEGKDTCVIVPGNYGVTFLSEKYDMKEKDIVLCSNFVGDSIRFAVESGFRKILFCSHIGKMIKVSGGIMNTHSKYGDNRMELMNEAFMEAAKTHSDIDKEKISKRILDCVTTTAALDVLSEYDLVKEVSEIIVGKSVYHLTDASDNKAEISCILYENNYGELARNF